MLNAPFINCYYMHDQILEYLHVARCCYWERNCWPGSIRTVNTNARIRRIAVLDRPLIIAGAWRLEPGAWRTLYPTSPSVTPSRWKAKGLLHNVVDDELRGDDHADVDDARLCPREEGWQPSLIVDVGDDSEEALAAGSLEGLREDHIPRLARDAGAQGGDEGRRDRNDPLEVGGRLSLHGQGSVQNSSNNVEGHLLGHCVGNLRSWTIGGVEHVWVRTSPEERKKMTFKIN